MENMKKICIDDEGEEVLYCYSVTGSGNARAIHIARYEESDEEYDGIYYDEYNADGLGEHDIMIAKADWYCIAFPDMGTASPALRSIKDYGFVADQVHDAGYWGTDIDAITLAIMDIADTGF